MRLVTWLWLAFLVALSLAPFGVKFQLGTKGQLHDVGHFLAFLATAVLLSWNRKTVRSYVAGCLGACALAIFLEALETAVYRNHFEWHDVAMDSFGAAMGFAILSAIPVISNADAR